MLDEENFFSKTLVDGTKIVPHYYVEGWAYFFHLKYRWKRPEEDWEKAVKYFEERGYSIVSDDEWDAHTGFYDKEKKPIYEGSNIEWEWTKNRGVIVKIKKCWMINNKDSRTLYTELNLWHEHIIVVSGS